MVDTAIRKYGLFLEKLLLWLIEGEKSPFIRDTPPALILVKKLVKKHKPSRSLIAHR